MEWRRARARTSGRPAREATLREAVYPAGVGEPTVMRRPGKARLASLPEEFVEPGVGPDPAARHSGRAWWVRVAAPQVVQTYRAVPSSGQARKSQVSAGGQRGGRAAAKESQVPHCVLDP